MKLHIAFVALMLLHATVSNDVTTEDDDITTVDPTAEVCEPWTCAATQCENVTPCPAGTTLVSGRGYCGCCNECVTPQLGDTCYTNGLTGLPTCGNLLKCSKKDMTCVERRRGGNRQK